MGNTLSNCFCNTASAPHTISLKGSEMASQEIDNDQWLKHFISQAKTLQKKHIWAKKMASKLKSFKCPCSRQQYLASVLTLSQTHNTMSQSALALNQSQSAELDETKRGFLTNYENNSFISTVPRKNEDGTMFYKLVSNLIERHLKETQNHHLGYLLAEFIDWFYENYKKVLILEHTKGLERKSLEKSHKTAVEHLQQFIRVFVETLMFYYQIQRVSNNGKLQAFSKDNFINFMTSILFSYDKIYQIIFFMQKALDQTLEQKFQMLLSLRDSFDITDYLIPAKFCVSRESLPKKTHKPKTKSQNEISFFSFSSEFETPNRTFCYQDNFKRPAEFESFHSFKQDEGDFYMEKFISFDDLPNQPKKTGRTASPAPIETKRLNSEEYPISNKSLPPPVYHYKRRTPPSRNIGTPRKESEGIKNNVEFIIGGAKSKPYSEAIKILEDLGDLRSPIHKMKRILIMISHIMRSISSLSESGIDSEAIDQKHLFCILLYVVEQSHCVDLHSQLKMIEKFSTNNVLSSVSGYYFTLLQLVVKFIGELDHGVMMGDEKKEYLKDRIEEILFNLKRNILF